MRAGSLNTRGQILRKVQAVDEAGAVVHEWQVLDVVWADVRHTSGLETMKAETLTSEVRASVRIRFRRGVHAGMRFAAGGAVYEIRAVMPDPARVFVDLVCERLGNAES